MNVGATENKDMVLCGDIAPLDVKPVAEVTEEFSYPSTTVIVR
jgi:hypothetical protein